ncbi:MAG: sigma-54-dependent Fis family transcriptional regulator, partial [Pararheinheimera sp.]|nr:sigma-54-dependent Fis family transcriptional regulator [Rheinheimera sp.]
MTQPLLFLHVQDPELTSQLLQSDSVRRFIICKSQPDECWAEQLLRQPCDLAFIEIESMEQAQYELLQQSNRLAEIDFILVSKGIPDLALDQLMH